MVQRVTHASRLLATALHACLLATACASNDQAPPNAGTGGLTATAGSPGSTAGRASSSAGRASGDAGRTNQAGTGGNAGSSAGATATGGTTSDAGAAGAEGGGAPSALTCLHDGDGTTTLAFVNGCPSSVTYAGSDIDGGTLAPGSTECVNIGSDTEALSAKRYWGWVGDDPGGEHHSLAEFTFNTDFNDFDWYNISYVDAFNLPLAIEPFARPDCETLACADDFLAECPSEGQFEQDGELVACVSPERDNGDSPVALYFEQCDDAYAWSGDDQNGDDPSPVRACAGEDWVITFCPEPPL